MKATGDSSNSSGLICAAADLSSAHDLNLISNNDLYVHSANDPGLNKRNDNYPVSSSRVFITLSLSPPAASHDMGGESINFLFDTGASVLSLIHI